MYRVLIPVDTDEERARKQIETLESLPEPAEPIEVHVLHVYEEITTPADEAGSAPIEDLNESLDELRNRPESVEWVIEALEAMDIDPFLHELVDEPVDGILSTAREIDADTILVGIRERTPIGKVVFGSVSQQVIHRSDRPVLIAR
ncbi:MAG: universal stress protein [Halodesulfurarchaeum sp.]|nr:universal stress protein [Halodesulfurarchaeum sp.]